ncbi:hypothetical protein O181_056240 [Austropuccinia psidii MF-1]|uniref:Uncharacterized protein n=1 Tax=Austropuccinia psidii MF-1 TaxID=1389203 RepID=A0A9Q3E5T7_9BASI|nr:hypothetical protein [Austropuccinia psidii MF-1]
MVSIWKNKTIEYCCTCDRCQKANRSTGKKFGLMIHIQEPKCSWEVAHMDWVTALPPSGDKSYNSCLVIVDRYRKTSIFLPCYKNDTALDTALPPTGDKSCNSCLVIVDRYRKTSIFLSFHNNDTSLDTALLLWNGLADRVIQTLEDMIRRFCAYGLEFKDSDGFNYDLFTLIPALELAYKTLVHSSTGQTPAMLEK